MYFCTLERFVMKNLLLEDLFVIDEFMREKRYFAEYKQTEIKIKSMVLMDI